VKLYLETSVPNFLFVTDAPEKREMTETLFEQILAGRHESWVSDLYTEEVVMTPSPLLADKLERVIELYGLKELETDHETVRIARAYIDAHAFTENNRMDALHVAAAVQHGCDVVVSWNFRHIVRAWTIKLVNEVNAGMGLGNIVICTPQEVIEDA
jgi:predicted nucleic acid-binding protein